MAAKDDGALMDVFLFRLSGLAVMEKSKKKREKKKSERIGNITNEPEQKKSHQRFSVSGGLNYLFCGVTMGKLKGSYRPPRICYI